MGSTSGWYVLDENSRIMDGSLQGDITMMISK